MKTIPGVVCVLAAVLALPVSVAAQAPAPAWGVGNRSSFNLQAWDMQTVASSTTWQVNVKGGFRYLTSPGELWGGVQVPRGVRIVLLELEACDTNALTSVSAVLYRGNASTVNALATASTGLNETPGCGKFQANLPAPELAEPGTYRYWVGVTHDSYDGTTSIGGVRIFYEHEVAPAPGVASFLDVPTSDPAFQFVEALFSSGVTAGCGNGNYCPDAPLTRRQMAVFLSKLLGLNWPEAPAP